MTAITIYRNSKNEYIGFKCKGHSGFAEHGSDIVCAAISMLTINTINSIEKLTFDKFALEEDEIKGLIKLRFSRTATDKSSLLMDSYILGIQNLIDSYGKQFVKLNFKEV